MALESSNSAASTACGGSGAKPHDGLRANRAASAPATAPDRATEPAATFGETLVDAAAVAAFLAVDKATVYRLASSAALPAIEVAPRVLRFRPADVRDFLERRTRKAAPRGRVKQLLGGGS